MNGNVELRTEGDGDDGHGKAAGLLTPLEFVLRQGTSDQLASMRERVAASPWIAVEVADSMAWVERFRQVTVVPSAAYAGRLQHVMRRAGLRSERQRTSSAWRNGIWVAAAAGITWACLDWVGPRFQLDSKATPPAAMAQIWPRSSEPGLERVASEASATPELPTTVDIEFDQSLRQIRRRLAIESVAQMSAELELGLKPPDDALRCWLDPQNALVELRLGHEQRLSAAEREVALRRWGGMAGADLRVQRLADSIAESLAQRLHMEPPPSLLEVALALRALIAAGAEGAARSDSLRAGATWLAARLPAASGADLANGLSGLVEVAAVQGICLPVVVAEGQRLVDQVLQVDNETWERRRPDLLMPRVSTATLAEAGRTVALLPGLGVSPTRCALLRRLLLGALRERLTDEQGPAPVAGLLYGFADMLRAAERTELEQQLRRWKPFRLVPDFATVHHLAWSMEQGRVGYTALQGQLRRLAVVDDPLALGNRSLLCMSLATHYAAAGMPTLQHMTIGD